MSIQKASKTQTRKDIQSGEWAHDNGLFHDLLTYGYRKQSPIDVLKAIRGTCESMGKYAQCFTVSDINDRFELHVNPNQYWTILHYAGSWACKGVESTNSTYYANPIYTHDKYPPISDPDRRAWLLTKTYRIPYWEGTRLGAAFGLSRSQADRIRRKKLGKLPDGYQRHDMATWARTIKTLTRWGHTYEELSDLFPYTKRALEGQVARNAAEYRVPSNPYK